jgi:hypothetical protein
MVNSVEDLDNWRAAALEQWKDARIVDGNVLDAWIWFFMHSWADFAKIDATLIKFSCRDKDDLTLMVVTLRQGDTQRVGFVTSADPTHCIKKLRRLLRKGELELYEDRFA